MLWPRFCSRSLAMTRKPSINLRQPLFLLGGMLLDSGTDVVGSPDGIAVVRVKAKVPSKYPKEWLFAKLRS